MSQANPSTVLLIPREDAKQQLMARITSGRAFLDRRFDSEAELEAAEREHSRWSDFNEELLHRIFSDASMAEEYRQSYAFLGMGVGSSWQQDVSEFRDLVSAGINKLESIKERLELIPDVATRSRKQEATEHHVDRRKVFVVYGRNNAARDAMFTFLRAIGLDPLEWSQIVQATGKAAPYIGEVLEKGFSIVQAVIVLMTPDDEARLRESHWQSNEPQHEKEFTPQPRQNVLFEAGMALGLFPDRTILVELGKLRPISDVGGRHTIRMNDSTAMRQELAQRLATAGCTVNLTGTDWHKAGSFDLALTKCQSMTAESGDLEGGLPQAILQYMDGLSADELYHVALALVQNTQTISVGYDDAVAASLAHKAIIEKIPFEPPRKTWNVPYLFPNPVWEYLCKNKEAFIERAVAANAGHDDRLKCLRR